MSTKLSKVQYQGRALELQWINATISCHDLMCGCNDPIGHFHHLTKEKCLTGEKDSTVATGGITDKEETGFDEGDLEQLFAQSQDDEG